MKVGLVLEQFDVRRGGAEKWTARFAEQLAARGHEVHVVAGSFTDETRRLPIVPHRLERAGSRLGFGEAAQARLLSIAPDVIHDMGAGWFCDVFHPHNGSMAALARQKLASVPWWQRALKARVDPLLPRHRCFQRLLERQYVDDGRLVVALSKRVAADFQRLHGVPRDRIRLIYNGVNTDDFAPTYRQAHREEIRRRLGVSDDTLLGLIVTHNFQLKGVPVLLRAIRRLHRSNRPVHLAVVGGKRVGRWQLAARQAGLARRVTFVGAVDDPVPYYAAADLYLHPTFYDSCSLVVLEALACGLPVITSVLNGAGELMADGREGYLLSDPTDIATLVARIESLLDPDRRRRMGEAARRLALQHTLARNVDQLLAVYHEILDARACSAIGAIQCGPTPSRRNVLEREVGMALGVGAGR
jgi:UDP-glucose:(heptosyl)LPS alpha-1,3-glucosyltransferase